MAGNILKIVIENTHPPVWRRVVVPDRISLGMLHRTIQILFGWDDAHMHEFHFPSKNLRIGSPDFYVGFDLLPNDEHRMLKDILSPGEFAHYTYDFGDDWRHKIIFEKTDESYEAAYPTLLKFKGDDFAEDSGGVYISDARIPFVPEHVADRLRSVVVPEHCEDDVQLPCKDSALDRDRSELLFDPPRPDEYPEDIIDRILQSCDEDILERVQESFLDKLSASTRMMYDWSDFSAPPQDNDEALKEPRRYRICIADQTMEQMLEAHSESGLADFCRYLQMPVTKGSSKKVLTHTLAGFLTDNPKYILYALDRRDLSAIRKLIRLAAEPGEPDLSNMHMPVKAVSLGLLQFSKISSDGQETAQIDFASDAEAILDRIDAGMEKRTYEDIDHFTTRLHRLILAYGVVDVDRLYKMYVKTYRSKPKKTEFLRYIYWHETCNMQLTTFTTGDGTACVADTALDPDAILESRAILAPDLDYRKYSRKELLNLPCDACDYPPFDGLAEMLTDLSGLPEYAIPQIIQDMRKMIRSGDAISEIARNFDFCVPGDNRIMVACDIWRVLAIMICLIPMPMFKGRTREEYMAETGKKLSETGVTAAVPCPEFTNDADARMIDLPEDIQRLTVDALREDSEALQELMEYREKHGIKSEELTFFIAGELMCTGRQEEAALLLGELCSGTDAAIAAVEFILGGPTGNSIRLFHDEDTDGCGTEDEDFSPARSEFDWLPEGFDIEFHEPYRRSQRKVGRNEPCPCGSGRKYKHCCGRSN